jgi:predicted N-formylglutamate amidohydrolase
LRAPLEILVTCEHGGRDVPDNYRQLFRSAQRLLASHRGYDIGAREAAQYLKRRLRAPLVVANVTRLLVDLNRSLGHPRLFSELVPTEDNRLLEQILSDYYHPYRDLVSGWIAARTAGGGRVLHLSVHSFVAALDGRRRKADVGLLYDPSRFLEKAFCRGWQERLVAGGRWVVRRNYPYRGTADGFTVALRRRFPAGAYVGIEIELNQGTLESHDRRLALLRDLATTLSMSTKVVSAG